MEIVDLTYEINEDMVTFASWHPKVLIEQLGKYESEGRETKKITLGTHTGTHMDAPLHFLKNGMGVDQVYLGKLIGEVTIVDFSDLREGGIVTKEILEKINITKRMLFKFDWGKHWGTEKFCKDYPYFSEEAAEYLVSSGVELVAMDTPSPDKNNVSNKDIIGTDLDSPIHKIFFKNNVLLVEYIANLDKITDYKGWNIIVMPLKIKGGDGSPARVCLQKCK